MCRRGLQPLDGEALHLAPNQAGLADQQPYLEATGDGPLLEWSARDELAARRFLREPAGTVILQCRPNGTSGEWTDPASGEVRTLHGDQEAAVALDFVEVRVVYGASEDD